MNGRMAELIDRNVLSLRKEGYGRTDLYWAGEHFHGVHNPLFFHYRIHNYTLIAAFDDVVWQKLGYADFYTEFYSKVKDTKSSEFTRYLCPKGNVRYDVYEALITLKERLESITLDAMLTLCEWADRLMRKVYGAAYDEGSVYKTLEAAILAFLTLENRLETLSAVLLHFETYGTALKDEAVVNEARSAFSNQLDEIERVCMSGDFPKIKNNKDLYCEAAKRSGISYKNDEANTYSKSMRRNFSNRFGRDVPRDPSEWKQFFETGQKGNPVLSPPDTGQDSL